MLTSLLKFSKRLFTSLFVVIGITAIAVLIPCPVSAMPTTLLEPAPSSQPPSPDLSNMNDKVSFDIVFGIGLFVLAIGAFAFVASSKSFTRFNDIIDRMCAISDTLKRHLLPFRLSTFFTRSSSAIAGANNASAPSTRDVGGLGGGGGSVPSVSYPSIPMTARSPDPQSLPTVSV